MLTTNDSRVIETTCCILVSIAPKLPQYLLKQMFSCLLLIKTRLQEPMVNILKASEIKLDQEYINTHINQLSTNNASLLKFSLLLLWSQVDNLDAKQIDLIIESLSQSTSFLDCVVMPDLREVWRAEKYIPLPAQIPTQSLHKLLDLLKSNDTKRKACGIFLLHTSINNLEDIYINEIADILLDHNNSVENIALATRLLEGCKCLSNTHIGAIIENMAHPSELIRKQSHLFLLYFRGKFTTAHVTSLITLLVQHDFRNDILDILATIPDRIPLKHIFKIYKHSHQIINKFDQDSCKLRNLRFPLLTNLVHEPITIKQIEQIIDFSGSSCWFFRLYAAKFISQFPYRLNQQHIEQIIELPFSLDMPFFLSLPIDSLHEEERKKYVDKFISLLETHGAAGGFKLFDALTKIAYDIRDVHILKVISLLHNRLYGHNVYSLLKAIYKLRGLPACS
jgi:hypothetical protein